MIEIAAALALFAADRLGKKASREGKTCEGKCLAFTNSANPGAFLRMGEKSPQITKALAGGMTLAVLGAAVKAYASGADGLRKTALCLLLSGALSNTLDRFTKGYVTDYLQLRRPGGDLGRTVYNLADFSVFAGAGILIVSELKK